MLHVFCKQLHFLLQPQVIYSRMNFQPKSCLAVAYSIQFQPLVAYRFLPPGLLIFKWFFFSCVHSVCLEFVN